MITLGTSLIHEENFRFYVNKSIPPNPVGAGLKTRAVWVSRAVTVEQPAAAGQFVHMASYMFWLYVEYSMTTFFLQKVHIFTLLPFTL